MSFLGTLEVLTLLKERIEGLTWTQAGGVAEAAFQRVELFDVSELELALEELLVFKDRACFVVLSGETFDNEELGGVKRTCRQRRDVALLVTDRNYGKRARVLAGTDGRPGVFELHDIVLNGVIGKLTQGLFARPTVGQMLRFEREKLAGRLAAEIDLELVGGSVEYSVGLGPVR